MAAILGNEYKYTYGYSVSFSDTEKTSRTISGLNISSSVSQPNLGPTAITLADNLYSMLTQLSTGTVATTNRFISERAVTQQ